jgi:hypothetical protein
MLALAIAATVLGLWELYGRSLGFEPTLRDDVQAWLVIRDRIESNSTVILGTSRVQAALDPAVWAEELGCSPPLQLAIAGGSVLPLLDDLADLESFRGLLVVGLVPRIEFDATRHRQTITESYRAAYEQMLQSPARRAEAQLRSSVPRTVLKNPGLTPKRVVGGLIAAWRRGSRLEDAAPVPPYFLIRNDRFMQLDFARANSARLGDALVDQISERGYPAKGMQLDHILARIERSARKIEDRGGRVVFVHLPHCCAVKRLEERLYPRSEYWDRLARLGVGETVYTDDYSSLNHFDCPDGSHLDFRDAAPFTRALVQVIDKSPWYSARASCASDASGREQE